MNFKLDLGGGEGVEWKDIADLPEFKKASPSQKAATRQTFLKQMAADNPDMKDEDVMAFHSHANDVENPKTAEGAKGKSDILEVPSIAAASDLAVKAGEAFNKADKPILERVAPGVAAKIRAGSESMAQKAQKGAEKGAGWLAGETAGKYAGKGAHFVAKAIGDLPVDLTSPTNLAFMGTEAVGKNLAKQAFLEGAAGTGAKEMMAKRLIGEGGVRAASGEVAKELSSPAAKLGMATKPDIPADNEIPAAERLIDAKGNRIPVSEENLTRQALAAEGAPAPRGALSPKSKSVLDKAKKPGESQLAEPAVEPASETPVAPASEAPVGSQMAEEAPKPKVLSEVDQKAAAKAGEAELRAQPKDPMQALADAQTASRKVKQTAEELKAENAIRKELSEAVDGRVPKAPATEGSLASKIGSKVSRLLHIGEKKFIDPAADVRAMGFDKTHGMNKTMNDRSVAQFSEDMAPAEKALTDNLKDAADKSLWNKIYNLRSMQEMWDKEGIDYGKVGSKAAQIIEGTKNALVAKGQEARWNRINAAVEQFADATRDVGLRRLKGMVDDKTIAEWSAKHRYYRSFQNFDADAAKMIHGEEGVATNTLPSMEDYASGFLKKRTGGAAINDDPFFAFQQSHWRKIVAGQKKELIDTAVKEASSKYDQTLSKEFEVTGGKGWSTYKTADGEVHPMPEPVVQFLTRSDPRTTSLFNEMAKAMNPISRRGYLDLNVRYYPGMVLRDVADTILRAPGYLTSQTEFLAKKLGAATGMKEQAPNLEYILNPAPWLRGLKASWRVNFGKAGKNTDAIFSELEKQGALQTGTVQHAMRSENLRLLYPETSGGKAKQLAGEIYEGMGRVMKAWDDTIRIGNALRNTPQELRGLKNMKNVLSLEHLPKGMVSDSEMAKIVRNTHIDFKMQGDGMRELKFLNPFLNPAIQDKYQTLQYAKSQPASFALTTAAFMAAATASYMKWKAKPEGRLLNPRDTQRFILVDSGVRSKEGGVYAIPAVMIPDSIQPIWIALRNAIDVMDEKSPEFKAILKKNYAVKTASQGAGAMANISGPLVAMVETAINHSFYTGKPVEGRYNDNLSSGLRAGKNVPNVFRYVGEKTGLSPDKMAYLNRGILGAPGQAVASALDKPFANRVKLPIEGSDAPFSVGESLKRKGMNLPKTLGVVREQKYDKSYDEMQEFLEPSLSKDADARELVRAYGQRFGQEKDPKVQEQYLNRAVEIYKQYVANLQPDEKPIDFKDLFGTAVKDAVKSSVMGASFRTVGALRKKYPARVEELRSRWDTKEEGQGQ